MFSKNKMSKMLWSNLNIVKLTYFIKENFHLYFIAKHQSKTFIDMFEILKAIWKEKDCDLFNFWTKNWRTCQKINDILCLMLVRTNFKGNKTLLLKRIQKLLLNQEYSVREEKLFKKLVSIQLKSGKIDFNQIEYFLPGKNPEEIRRKAGRILISL